MQQDVEAERLKLELRLALLEGQEKATEHVHRFFSVRLA
jgi:hypothetical protein